MDKITLNHQDQVRFAAWCDQVSKEFREAHGGWRNTPLCEFAPGYYASQAAHFAAVAKSLRRVTKATG